MWEKAKDIIKNYAEEAKNIYNAYKLQITQKEFNDINIATINTFSNVEELKASYLPKLEQNIAAFIDERNTVYYQDITNYINEHISDNFTYSKTLEFLTNLTKFIRHKEMNIDIDLCFKLIENNTYLEQSLKLIIDKNYNFLIKNNLELFSDNELMQLFVYAYCNLHNILSNSDNYQINKQDVYEELEENESYEIDSLRLLFRDVLSKTIPTPEEHKMLFKKLQNETDVKKKILIRNEIVERNLRLVLKIAKGYCNRGLDYLELFQEGSIGLIKATYKYDYQKGYQFSTYATYWVRCYVSRAIGEYSRTIKLPFHLLATLGNFYREEEKLTMQLGRIPSNQELVDHLGISLDKVREYKDLAQVSKSLDEVVTDDGDTDLADLIADENAKMPNLAAIDLQRLIDNTPNLDDKEINVLYLRYGVKDGKERTLQEIGEMYHVTRERIRQIEFKALSKLRKTAQNRVNKLFQKEAVKKEQKEQYLAFPHEYLERIFKVPREVLEYGIEKLTIAEQQILQTMFGPLYNERFSEKRVINNYYFSKFNLVIDKLRDIFKDVTLYEVLGVSKDKTHDALNNLEKVEQEIVYTIWDKETLQYITDNYNYVNAVYFNIFNKLNYQLLDVQNKQAISLEELLRVVNLSTNEKEIFNLKYGLRDGSLKTVEEIRELLHIKDVTSGENSGINKIRKFLQEHTYTSLVVNNSALQMLNIKLFNNVDKTLAEEICEFIKNARRYLNLENYSDKEISIFYLSVFKDIYVGYISKLFSIKICDINTLVKGILSENNLNLDKSQLEGIKLKLKKH